MEDMPQSMTVLTDDSFARDIASGIWLVLFWDYTCGQCKLLNHCIDGGNKCKWRDNYFITRTDVDRVECCVQRICSIYNTGDVVCAKQLRPLLLERGGYVSVKPAPFLTSERIQEKFLIC